MSMGIMYQRYGEFKILPMELVANQMYASECDRLYNEKPENLWGNEHTEFFIKPLEWNDEEKVHGLVAPLCMPIYEKSEMSFQEVKNEFIKLWKKGRYTENFRKNLWIVSSEVKSSRSKEIESYIKWRDSSEKENLAFIYLGHFWMYKDENETLNEAAKRFFKEHSSDELLQKALKREFKKERWKKDKCKYIKAIINDGALVFNRSSKHAISQIHCYLDPAAVVWVSLAIKGYFSWVTQINFVSSDEYDEYL